MKQIWHDNNCLIQELGIWVHYINSFFFSASLKLFTIKSLESLNAMWYPALDPGKKKVHKRKN